MNKLHINKAKRSFPQRYGSVTPCLNSSGARGMIKSHHLESAIHPYTLLDKSCASQAFSAATTRVFLACPQAPCFRQQAVFSPSFPTRLAHPAGQAGTHSTHQHRRGGGHTVLHVPGKTSMFIAAPNSRGRAPQVKMLSRESCEAQLHGEPPFW